MATYRDNRGKDWPIEFSDAALTQARDLLKLDLTDWDSTEEALANHATLLQTAQILCRDEIAACKMPTRQFMKRTIYCDPTGLLRAIRKASDEWQTKDVCPVEPEPIIDPIIEPETMED